MLGQLYLCYKNFTFSYLSSIDRPCIGSTGNGKKETAEYPKWVEEKIKIQVYGFGKGSYSW